jgi:hypothetical protein
LNKNIYFILLRAAISVYFYLIFVAQELKVFFGLKKQKVGGNT